MGKMMILLLDNYNTMIGGRKLVMEGNILILTLDAAQVKLYGYWHDTDGSGNYFDELKHSCGNLWF